MTGWIPVGALEDIPVRGARTLKTRLGCIAVFRTAEDDVFALMNQCPHKAGPLSEGIVHGRAVTCPLHNWVISLESGEALGSDDGKVVTFSTRVADGTVYVDGAQLERHGATTKAA